MRGIKENIGRGKGSRIKQWEVGELEKGETPHPPLKVNSIDSHIKR